MINSSISLVKKHVIGPILSIPLESQPACKLLESDLMKIERICLEIASTTAAKRKGGLIIIGNTTDFTTLFPDLFEGRFISLFEPGVKKILEKLIELDGAIVIDRKGIVRAFGAYLARQKALPGHGTRHAAARGVTLDPGIKAILISEEDNKVRVFEQGRQVFQL